MCGSRRVHWKKKKKFSTHSVRVYEPRLSSKGHRGHGKPRERRGRCKRVGRVRKIKKLKGKKKKKTVKIKTTGLTCPKKKFHTISRYRLSTSTNMAVAAHDDVYTERCRRRCTLATIETPADSPRVLGVRTIVRKQKTVAPFRGREIRENENGRWYRGRNGSILARTRANDRATFFFLM